MASRAYWDDDSYLAYSREVDKHELIPPDRQLDLFRELDQVMRSITAQVGLLPGVALKVISDIREHLRSPAARGLARTVEGIYKSDGSRIEPDADEAAFRAALARRIDSLERNWRRSVGRHRVFSPQDALSRAYHSARAEEFACLRLYDSYLDDVLMSWAERFADVRRIVRDIDHAVRELGVDGAAYTNLVHGRHADPSLRAALRAYLKHHQAIFSPEMESIIKDRQERLWSMGQELWINPDLLVEVAYRLRQLSAQRERLVARLVSTNLRLVLREAHAHSGRGLELMDLVQEGNAGLLRAVYRFDPYRGYQFSTCAVTWIRQRMQNAVATCDIVRLPDSKANLRRKAFGVAGALSRRGRSPTAKLIAAELKMSEESIAEVMGYSTRAMSLDAPVGDDNDGSRMDFIEDESQDPADHVDRDLVSRAIERAIATLDERAQQVIRMRFGIGIPAPRTLDEVGDALGLSRERVRQLETAAVGTLRGAVDPGLLASLIS